MKAQKKSLFLLVIALLTTAILTTACERSYAPAGDESLATPTMDGGAFPEAMPADMDSVFESGAQTATALAVASGVPVAAPVETQTPDANNPLAPTVAPAGVTVTSAAPVIATVTVAAPAPTLSVGKPASYTLQRGEFPYCIARRFNVSPTELLNLNGLSNAQANIYSPGLSLSIPQSGGAFPPPRALNAHPITYTLPKNMTVYAVACYFGDIDPATITNANSIPDPNNIAAGTVLSIP